MADSPAAAIAANRFGLGARPGEIEACAADPRAWLHAQLKGQRRSFRIPVCTAARP